MVTKLAPSHMTGTAMGGWFLSFAAANYVAGIIATATGQSHGADGEVATVSDSLVMYTDVYTSMGLITVGIGILLILIAKPLNKLMHGIT